MAPIRRRPGSGLAGRRVGLAAAAGMLAARRTGYSLAGLAIFGVLAAAATRPNATPLGIVPALAGVAICSKAAPG
jgi:hypothetical protein